VSLTGYQADPRPLYEAMDLFVLSSLREGLPNVLLEAMAMTVPVIATEIAGIPRLVQDGVNGVLVAPGSAKALAKGIADLVRQPDLRSRIANAGRATVETQYSFARRMEKIADLYDGMLREGTARLV